MGGRRGSRRRRRRADSTPAAADSAATSEASAPSEPASTTTDTSETGGSGYGRAALLLALLVGIFVERVVVGVAPSEAVDVFHLVVAIGIAFLVARWYRGFMRRTLGRARSNRQSRGSRRR